MARRTKKEILLEKKLEEMNSNYSNVFGIFNNRIKTWIIECLENFSVEQIKTFDAYKAYRLVEFEETSNDWVSPQGASMTTYKCKAIFEFNDKNFKQDFIITKGNW